LRCAGHTDEEIFPPHEVVGGACIGWREGGYDLGGGKFQLIGPEQLQSGTPHAFHRSLALELS
jgi:hypothetical protein